MVYEQRVHVSDPETGELLTLRRIEVRLFEKTRDGERTSAVLTNLPAKVTAVRIAELYLARWTIATHLLVRARATHLSIEQKFPAG